MLPTSHLFTFLDRENHFALHFLEGQKLIQDLALIHHLKGEGFQSFRNAVLSIQPIISLLKNGETLGVYIDGENPFFMLKLETNFQGFVRTLLLPEDFNQFPSRIKGRARTIKKTPQSKNPYTSIVELNHISFEEVINQIFKVSYQIKAKILISEKADQCLMVTKLPGPNPLQEDHPGPSLEEYLLQNKKNFLNILDINMESPEQIKENFQSLDIEFLLAKPIRFRCECSEEQMMNNLVLLEKTLTEGLFSQSPDLDLTCDYCKAKYKIQEKSYLEYCQNLASQGT